MCHLIGINSNKTNTELHNKIIVVFFFSFKFTDKLVTGYIVLSWPISFCILIHYSKYFGFVLWLTLLSVTNNQNSLKLQHLTKMRMLVCCVLS